MAASTAGSFGLVLGVTAALACVLMGATFVLARAGGRHRIVDTTWGIGIAALPVAALVSTAGGGQQDRRILLAAASVAWGSRLAVFTAWRGAGQGEDPRYRDLLRRARRHPDRYALRVIYLPQGLILWLATAPVQAGMLAARPADAVTVAGAVLWLAGFAFETTGDCQLARFKSRPRDSGSIMDRGLWRYTRHPNYFGDACMWWGLYLAAYGGWPWLPGALAPLAMTFLLVRGTGQRLTERRMAGRPGYAAYIRRTSGFFPLPPRVVAAARRRRPPR
ncbi:MAG: DUF1295 domain-containing protein [Streptosporangiales bacterium]|nr:DUF1295 domain-containing protein [Streptosporangiales bacterium]